jgi:tetratricopeptide (TPR) repeat protein
MKKVILSAVAASMLFGTQATAKTEQGSVPHAVTVKQVNQTAVAHAKQDAVAREKKMVQEAIDSLKNAHDALLALDRKDKDAALMDIEKALGKLEVVLSAKDAPMLLPIKSYVVVNEFVGTSDGIKASLKIVKALLDHGKVQQARRLLLPLTSEIDTTTVSLPMASYPDALKLAAKYIHSDKIAMAKEVLAIALNTFDESTVVIPLPLLKATDLIVAASDIASKNKEQAIRYLEGASENLKVAEALGYVSKSTTSYKVLQDKIKEVEKEIRGKNKAEKLFDTLKEKLADFKAKVFSPKK